MPLLVTQTPDFLENVYLLAKCTVEFQFDEVMKLYAAPLLASKIPIYMCVCELEGTHRLQKNGYRTHNYG